MKYMRASLACLAMCVLMACATLVPQTFNERVAVGLQTVTSVRSLTTTLLDAKVITSKDAINVQTQANLAREGIEIARTLETVEASDKLDASIQILSALQKYLSEKQKDVK